MTPLQIVDSLDKKEEIHLEQKERIKVQEEYENYTKECVTPMPSSRVIPNQTHLAARFRVLLASKIRGRIISKKGRMMRDHPSHQCLQGASKTKSTMERRPPCFTRRPPDHTRRPPAERLLQPHPPSPWRRPPDHTRRPPAESPTSLPPPNGARRVVPALAARPTCSFYLNVILFGL